MAHEEIPYSLDDDFTELQDKDKTVELSGWICSIEAPTKQKTYDLFKFGLTNGTKKVMCLVWGKELIDRFQPEVTLNRRLHMNGGHCKLSKFPSRLEVQGFLPHEINIQSTTVMSFGDNHLDADAPPVIPPRTVNFETIKLAEGKISIDGFIKTEFTATPSRFQNATYACGSITDGTFKVIVHISNYSTPVESRRGMPVQVIGTVVNDTSVPLTITCSDSSFITPRETDPLPEFDLLRANRTLKRTIPPD